MTDAGVSRLFSKSSIRAQKVLKQSGIRRAGSDERRVGVG
jgi:hypothetical protein